MVQVMLALAANPLIQQVQHTVLGSVGGKRYIRTTIAKTGTLSVHRHTVGDNGYQGQCFGHTGDNAFTAHNAGRDGGKVSGIN